MRPGYGSGTKPVTQLRPGIEMVWVSDLHAYRRVWRVTRRDDGYVIVATPDGIYPVPEWAQVRWIGVAEAEDCRA